MLVRCLPLLLLPLAGCAGDARPRNLLLITLDTVRADALGHLGGRAGGSPSLDRLAAEGITFTDAWTTRGQTWPALASLLTGRLPLGHGTRQNGFPLAPGVPTMAEPFRRGGFRTGAFLSNACAAWGTTHFDYLSCTAPPEELAGDQSRMQRRWDRRAIDEALAWIGQGHVPFFAWVHLFDAHRPYPTVPKLRERFLDADYQGRFRAAPGEAAVHSEMPLHDRVGAAARSGVRPAAADLEALRAYYEAGVFAVDRDVGRLLDELRERELLCDTLVVVAADHGESLFDHANFPYHGAAMHGATLRVPLIFRWPEGGLEPARVARPVGLIDVVPTLLELFDLPAAERVDGVSLVPALSGRPAALLERDHMTELVALDPGAFLKLIGNPKDWAVPEIDGDFFAIRRADWRLVWNPEALAVHEPPFEAGAGLVHSTALYDLGADPGETTDVSSDYPEVVAELRAALESWVERLRATTPASRPPDPEMIMRLQQLGYLGDPDR